MDLKHCRLCLNATSSCTLIFNDIHQDNVVPLALKIAVCVSLSVTPQDTFTKFICANCSALIEQFYTFRETCMNNYLQLVGMDSSELFEGADIPTEDDNIDVTTTASGSDETADCVATHVFVGESTSDLSGVNIVNVKSRMSADSTTEDNGSESDISYQEYEEILDPDAVYSSDSDEVVVPFVEYEEENIGDATEAVDPTAEKARVEDGADQMYYDVCVESADQTRIVESKDAIAAVHVTQPKRGAPPCGEGVEDGEDQMYYDMCVESADQMRIVESKDAIAGVHVTQLKRGVNSADSFVYRFRCQKCNEIFVTADALAVHQAETCADKVVVKQETEEPVFIAVDPQYLVLDSGDVDAKRARAKWGEKRLYNCPVCSKSFRSSSMLHTHQRTHTGERPFVCTLCPRSFSQMGALRNHERDHRRDWPYRCERCTKGFFRPSDLQKHVRTHTDERPYRCDVCERGFHQQSGLVVHQRIHSGERPYSCSLCHMTFSQLSNKYRHMKTHAGGLKPLSCGLCHRKFADRKDLEMHRAVHDGGKPRICPHCEKGFRKAYELRDHMRRVHTNERPYTCQLCNKSFFVAHDLKNHLLVHTGERPYSCGSCEQTFTQAGNLKRHKLRHHKESLVLGDHNLEPSSVVRLETMDVDNMNMLQFDSAVD